MLVQTNYRIIWRHPEANNRDVSIGYLKLAEPSIRGTKIRFTITGSTKDFEFHGMEWVLQTIADNAYEATRLVSAYPSINVKRMERWMLEMGERVVLEVRAEYEGEQTKLVATTHRFCLKTDLTLLIAAPWFLVNKLEKIGEEFEGLNFLARDNFGENHLLRIRVFSATSSEFDKIKDLWWEGKSDPDFEGYGQVEEKPQENIDSKKEEEQKLLK